MDNKCTDTTGKSEIGNATLGCVRRSTYAVRMKETHRTYAIFEDRQHAEKYARSTMYNDAYVDEIFDEEIDKYFA